MLSQLRSEISQLLKMFPKRFVPGISLKPLAALHWFCIGIHHSFSKLSCWNHFTPSLFLSLPVDIWKPMQGEEHPREKANDVLENLNLTPKGD